MYACRWLVRVVAEVQLRRAAFLVHAYEYLHKEVELDVCFQLLPYETVRAARVGVPQVELPQDQSGLLFRATMQPVITNWTPLGTPYENNWFELNKFSAMPFLFIHRTERTEKRVSNAPIVIEQSLGSARIIPSN